MHYLIIGMLREIMRQERKERMEASQKWATELEADLEREWLEQEKEARMSISQSGEIDNDVELEQNEPQIREPEELTVAKAEEFHLSDWDELMKKSKAKWQLFSWNPENKAPWVQEMEYHYRTDYLGHEIIIYTSCDKKLGGKSRPKGTDAIRVVVPKRFSKKILRTEGWQNRVQEAVKEAKRVLAG